VLTLVLIAAVGAWVGFTNPLFHFPLAALAFPLGLAWIGLRATSLKNSFKYGWLAGLLAGLGLLYWIVIPVEFYGGLPWYIALPCPFLVAAAMGVYFALFSSLMHFAGQRIDGIPLCLFAGLVWASMEMLMSILLSGFPWINLTSAFVPWPYAIQGASVVGAFGMSGLFTTLAVSLLLYSTYKSALKLAIVLLIIICGFGAYRVEVESIGEPDHMVSIAQGNIDQAQKWMPSYQSKTVEIYSDLSRQAIDKHRPRLVIWPETAMPFYMQDRTSFRADVELLARQTRTPIITGSPAYRVINLKTRDYDMLNRAWLVDELGRTTQSYDKEHLVPFGEYMPFKEYIPFEKLVQAAGDFVSGKDNKPLMLDGVALGMLICYEGIFPELAQKQVEKGATALLNISNDAWFGDTSAPMQHLNLSTLRAVEQGRWLVRSTNNGISAFVDPLGRIVAKTKQFEAAHLSAPIAPRKALTIYHRFYSEIGYTIYGSTALFILWLIVGSHRKKRQDHKI